MIVKLALWFIIYRVVASQKKVGDSCVEEYTGSNGICVLAEHCQSVRIAFENNGVRPTFCLSTFEDSIVCCRENGSFARSAATTSPPHKPTTTTPPPEPTTTTPPPEPTTTAPPPEPVARTPVLVKESDIPPVRNTSDGSQSSNTRISERKCEEYRRYGDSKTVAEAEPSELIIGGEPSALNEFPHMAAIGWLNFEDTYTFSCGGSLVSPRWVLTAGHCSSDPKARVRAPSVVRLGDLNIDLVVEDGADPEEIPIETIIRHPSFAPPLRYHDIALMMLVRPAELSAAVHPACLWDKAELTHSEAIAIGWGVSDVRTRRHSKVLQKVTLTLQDSSYCDRLLYVNRNRNWAGFVPEQLCAGELRPGKDTCQGDSGAPLQVKWKNTYRIVGITSFGLNNCAESGRPGVYTRVSSYVEWIEGVVWPEE